MAETKTLSKPRVYLWDNAKTLLIFAVVMGHFVTQYTGSNEIMQSMFVIIYSFHMPLFIFVSGLFTKYKNDKLQVNKLISYIILFYALKLIIYIERISFGHNSTFKPISESGIPWYMLAMAAWIAFTYLIRKANPKIVMPISIALALAAGYFDFIGDVFCISRIIVFYPFFLLGYYLDANKVIEVTRGSYKKVLAIVVLIALVALGFFAREELYTFRPILVARNPYSQLEGTMANPAFGALYRAAWYVIGSAVSLAIICLLPNKENRLSHIGAATLPIYFLHRPILYVLMDVGFGALIMTNLGAIWGPIVFLLSSVVLTFILSWPPLAKPFNALMKCKYEKLLGEKK